MNHGDIKLVIDQLRKHTTRRELMVADMLETLGNQVAAQSAVIEKLSGTLKLLSYSDDKAVRDIAYKALSIPTDSTQILQEYEEKREAELQIQFKQAYEQGIRDGAPEVKLTSMKESNGKTTWTVFLAKPGQTMPWDWYQVYSDTIKGRAEYEADKLKHFLGQGPEPDLLSYDTDPPKWDGTISTTDFRISTFVKDTGRFAFSHRTGVRIFHIPTGVQTSCCTERSEHANRHVAMEQMIETLNGMNKSD